MADEQAALNDVMNLLEARPESSPPPPHHFPLLTRQLNVKKS